MNIVSIFIAGAKNLHVQRSGLKVIANDLNTKYGMQKLNVSLVAHSYENFGEIQADYNFFIENQADLVVFVLEDRIGKKTEEEFLLATKNYKQNKRPKIITFVRSFDTRTPDIDHIEQLINSNTDSYYVEYKNNEDLFALAKDRFNAFVEDYIKKDKRHKWKLSGWKSLLYVVLALFIASILFIASVLFSPESYLVVTTPEPPTSLIKAGMGKEFVKQQIVEGVREAGDSAQIKLEAIINDLTEYSDTCDQSVISGKSPLQFNAALQNIVKGNMSNTWVWRLRRLLGKHDVQASVKLVESRHTYISRITLDTWEGIYNVKTIEANKNDFTSVQRCALSVIKKSAAYVTMSYSPVASALYDYRPLEGLEIYQMNSPWHEDLYTHSSREALLLENSTSDHEDAAYGLLLLANFYEQGSLEHSSQTMAQKACAYYKRFLKQNSLYKSEIMSKIKSIESILKQDKHEGRQRKITIPDILIQNKIISLESPCKQIIVVTDEEKLYDKGKTYFKALLHTFEKNNHEWVETSPAFKVNLGIRGMAYPGQKKEGDLKTPSGLYPIPFVFGYKKDINTKMNFVVVGKNHVWVCDSLSEEYNKLIVDVDGKYKNNQKNEKLFRPDVLNKYAIAIGYNMNPIVRGKGSAIFMHVQRYTNHKTAGCISMPEQKIADLIKWLDPHKFPYIYISKRID